MTPRSGLSLGVVIVSTLYCTSGFHQPGLLRIHQQNSATFQQSIFTSATTSSEGGRRADGVGSLCAKPAGPPTSSAAPGKDKEGEEQKTSGDKKRRGGRQNTLIRQAVEGWADDCLDLRRFQGKRIHICKAETLPEVLSEFWSLASMMAQEKYSAMASDRDYAAHALFVVPRCALLKDYGMMRHLDKVLDFCAGGCSDFGRTVTLQFYHPDFVLPPSRTFSGSVAAAAEDKSKGLARYTKRSRSPYPIFGLTAAAGSLSRSEPIEANDKIAHLRLDLELVYNSVAGRSVDDCVDSHGSPHGTIPSSPDEVQEKTLDWLFSLPSSPPTTATTTSSSRRIGEKGGSGEGAGTAATAAAGGDDVNEPGSPWCLTSSYEGGMVTSDLNSPEKVLSQVWSIVSQLQEEALPRPSPSPSATPPPSSSSSKTEVAAGAGSKGGAKAVAAVENWTEVATQGKAGAEKNVDEGEGGGHRGGVGGAGEEVGLEGRPLASTLLVAPRLHPFNAAQFENFARNLAIALKQAPIVDRIEVEVYHPELVCDGGVIDLDRRSPYPTLLLKHCGLKDILFEPSGKYRHALPPLKLPLDEAREQGDDDDNSSNKTPSWN